MILRDRFGVGLIHDRTTSSGKGGAGNPACGGRFKKRGGGLLVCGIGSLPPGGTVHVSVDMRVSGHSSKGAGKGVKRREKNVAVVSSRWPRDPNLKNNRSVATAKIDDGGRSCGGHTIVGTRKGDRLKGTRRDDTLLGLYGNDYIRGNQADDCLFGNEGRDRLIGGPGRDYMSGGDGNDRIRARDGKPDKIRCGAGKHDLVIADTIDSVAGDCERVRRA